MLYSLARIWKPESFHGHKKNHDFFEGWYFKILDKDGNYPMAIIPGIFINEDAEKHHSFIQILIGNEKKSHYVRYSPEDFSADELGMKVRIKRNFFRRHRIDLDIDEPEIRIYGNLKLNDISPWETTFFEPGIMGWYSFIPFMECNHGVLSMNHNIEGKLEVNGRIIDFTGGKGYTEKDWGSSFPSAYAWTQCNTFENSDASIMASVAKIPWFGNWFRGFICGLMIDGKLIRFATYTGARVNFLKVDDDMVKMEFEDKLHRLTLRSTRVEGGLLFAPYDGMMHERVAESLNSEIHVTLRRITSRGEKVIFEDKGINAGLEATGKLEEIID